MSNNEKLTDKQEAFVEEYIRTFQERESFSSDHARLKACAIRAGYSDTMAPSLILRSPAVAQKIVEYTNRWAAVHAPKAQLAIFELLERPTQMGGKTRLEAAKDVLDRSGVTKKQDVAVLDEDVQNIICVIPTKQTKDK